MSTTPPAPAAKPRDRAVAAWLCACALLVAAMVAVGGLTRLTRSGLSIVEWKPLVGALPPLGEAAWQAEFARYQGSPEFRLVNAGMTLDGFRQIYYVEWFHRLLGRLTGAVVLVPLAWFALRRRLSRKLALRMLGLFALGGLQGALGWFMVKSGLVDQPHVSPYRLTAHLALALALFVVLCWIALDEALPRPPSSSPALRCAALALLALVGLTVTWGGLMAGFHAGLVAPTFPTMNGQWFPDALRSSANALASPVAIHFTHRLLAYSVFVAAVLLAVAVRAARHTTPAAKRLAVAVLAVVVLQITLGAIVVLRLVPLTWASAHQIDATLLLATLTALLHQLTPAAHPRP